MYLGFDQSVQDVIYLEEGGNHTCVKPKTMAINANTINGSKKARRSVCTPWITIAPSMSCNETANSSDAEINADPVESFDKIPSQN